MVYLVTWDEVKTDGMPLVRKSKGVKHTEPAIAVTADSASAALDRAREIVGNESGFKVVKGYDDGTTNQEAA